MATEMGEQDGPALSPMDPYFEEIEKQRLIKVSKCKVILATNDFTPKEAKGIEEKVLKYLKILYPYALGDILFGLKYGQSAKLLYQYPQLAIIKDPRGGRLIVRELYKIPEGWAFRTHRGSIAKPGETVYVQIDPFSVRGSLKREIWSCKSQVEREELWDIMKIYFFGYKPKTATSTSQDKHI